MFCILSLRSVSIQYALLLSFHRDIHHGFMRLGSGAVLCAVCLGCSVRMCGLPWCRAVVSCDRCCVFPLRLCVRKQLLIASLRRELLKCQPWEMCSPPLHRGKQTHLLIKLGKSKCGGTIHYGIYTHKMLQRLPWFYHGLFHNTMYALGHLSRV